MMPSIFHQKYFYRVPEVLNGSGYQDQVKIQPSQLIIAKDRTSSHYHTFKTNNDASYRRHLHRNEARNLVAAIIIFLVIFVVTSRYAQILFPYFGTALDGLQALHGHQPNSQKVSFNELEGILQTEPNAIKIAEWSQYYTSQIHLAGEGKGQGLWTKTKWDEFGLPETKIVSYDAFVGVPVIQRLALLEVFEDKELSPKLMYEAALMEDMPENDPSMIRTPAYSGNSFSGNVTAQFIYANFGLSEDYDCLEEAEVDFKGKIAVVKNGKAFRGDKVNNAVKRGIIAIILYTDPQQDGNITEANGYKAYPDGPARPSTYIERGTINHFEGNSTGINPSVDGQSIPSLPVSYNDILPILRSLHGFGPKASEMSKSWHSGSLEYLGFEYYVGPSRPGIVLNLNNQVYYEKKKVCNVLGTIKGSTQEDVVILGNHRDAWTAGAGDPGSGSAALMEVVRSFAAAYRKGWRPRRTLLFASWEGEELGQIGSRAWISENLPWLTKSAVAYLNVVVAASGQTFHAKATPLLRRVIHQATKIVISPKPNNVGHTVFEHWGGEIFTAGGGDAIPFLQEACIPTVDIGFSPSPEDPIFPYHSNFDTFLWMDTVGDLDWKHHLATTKIWSLMAAHLVETPVLDFNVTDYANKLLESVEFIKRKIPSTITFSTTSLERSISKFYDASTIFDSYVSSLRRLLLKSMISDDTRNRTRQVNERYMSIERKFCHRFLQNGKNQSEHVIFEESPWYQSPKAFPRLLHSIESSNWTSAYEWRDIIKNKVDDAASLLEL